MEEKDFTIVVKETVLRMFHEEVQKKGQVELGDIYGAIMSGTLSAIGTIAQVAGDDPYEIVKEIVALTYKQVCTD